MRAVFRGPRRVAERDPRRRRRRGRDGVGGSQPGSLQSLQRPDRAPPPLHLRSGRAARHQGHQGLARGHDQRRGPGHRGRRPGPPSPPPRPDHGRRGAQGHDPRQRALGCRARRSREPRGRHDGPAPGVVPGAAGPPRHRAGGAERAEAGRPGRGRAGAHRAVRVRPAHDHGPGGPPDGAPALLQPGGDERPRPAVPALPGRAPDARDLPDGAAGLRAGPGRGPAVLRRQDQLRPRWRLRPDLGSRRAGGGRARLTRGAGRCGRSAPHRAAVRRRRPPWRHERQRGQQCAVARPRDGGQAAGGIHAHGERGRSGGGLPGGRDREVDRLHSRRRRGGVRGLGATSHRPREAGRRPRCGRGAPGHRRGGAGGHRVRHRRRASVRSRPPRDPRRGAPAARPGLGGSRGSPQPLLGRPSRAGAVHQRPRGRRRREPD